MSYVVCRMSLRQSKNSWYVLAIAITKRKLNTISNSYEHDGGVKVVEEDDVK